jgi:outer membrane protein insertion porin family
MLNGRRAAALAIGLIALVAATGILTVSTPAAAQAIVVQGNRRVDADTIRGYFQPRPGRQLDAARIDEGVKALYATGMFEDVRISRAAGGRLVVTVVENRIINRVAFEGNKKVKDAALIAEIQSKSRLPLSRPIVQADVQRIIEVYRRSGRFNVRVDPKFIDRPNNRVDLIFEISEGDRTTIRRIVFVGNKAFSDWRLRDTITSGTTNLLSFLKSNDIYDPDRVNADQELLRRFYLKNGYADFRILSANVVNDPRAGGFVLTITLDEGEQYRFGTIEVLSNVRTVDGATLRRLTRGSSGSIYNAELVEKSVEEITIELSRQGYAFAQVRPRGDRDFAAKRINVVYVVDESPRVYVERINIRGNTRTRDHVVRREFEIYEGDAYNRVLVDRAERRLKNLGFFKSVKITNETGSAADRVIINVELEEQLTGEFSVAAGYSTADGLIGEVSVGERNFLGRGQYVRVAATYGQLTKGAEFSFTEPYLFGYAIAAGFDLYSKQTLASTYYSYNMQLIGGAVRAGFVLREDLTLGVRYTIYGRNISLPTVIGLPTSIAVTQALGSALTSMVGYTLTFNRLDSNLDPREGTHIAFSQDFAGLGGNTNYVRTSIDARYFRPVANDYILMLRGQAGHMWGWGATPLAIFDHFFKGPELVRGFATAGLGPRDLTLGTSMDALGGSYYWGATAEVTFPVFFAPKDFGLRAGVFADAGALWGYTGGTVFAGFPILGPAACGAGTIIVGSICLADGHVIRSSVGVSLIWASPFGPLRFDYAFPITKAAWDRIQNFRFGVGTRF